MGVAGLPHRQAWVLRVSAWMRAGVAPRALPTHAMAWGAGVAFAMFVLLAVAVASGMTIALDTRLELAVHARATPTLDIAMAALTLLGTIPVVVATVLAVVALLVRVRRRLDAAALAAFMVGQGLLDDLFKLAIGRPRPQLFPHAAAHGFSFPSGHAMTTIALAGALVFLVWPRLPGSLRWAALLAAAAIVAGVGTSRVYLGVHYPSDVLGGWLAGAAWLGAGPWLLRLGAASVAGAGTAPEDAATAPGPAS